MGFIAAKIDDLPQRKRAPRTFDTESANALLGIVTTAGQTATDGESYKTAADARAAAGKARRLLVRVIDADKIDNVKTRVYADGATFRWALFLAAPKAEDKPAEQPAKTDKATK